MTHVTEAIDQELKRRGLKEGNVAILALPKSLKRVGIPTTRTRKKNK